MNCCWEESTDLEQDCLRQAAEAIHVPASYAFALQSDAEDDEQQWLGDAAHEGYTLAMYDYGLCCDDLRQKVHWLTTAAEEGDLRAMYLLAFECARSRPAPALAANGCRRGLCPGHVRTRAVVRRSEREASLAGGSGPERLAGGEVGT